MEHDECVCVADTHKRTRWEAFCDALTTNPFGSLFVNVSANWLQVFMSVLLSLCGKHYWDNKQKTLHDAILAELRQNNLALNVVIDQLRADFGKRVDSNGRSCSGMSSGSAQVLDGPGKVRTAVGPSSTEELFNDNRKTSSTDESNLAPISMCSHKDSEANLEEIICQAENLSANGDVNVMKGSTILETKVALRGNLLGRLHAIAVDRTRNDKKFTLQLDRKRLFFYTGSPDSPDSTHQGVKMMRLEDSHEVPVILESTYAAGTLTIIGLHLENAELKAASSKKSITLKMKLYKRVGELETLTCVVRLPSDNLNKLFVYATKGIDVGIDRKVNVRSAAAPIQDNTLRTVLRIGLPTSILVMIVASRLWLEATQIIRSAKIAPDLAWFLLTMAIFVIQVLPASAENSLRTWLERVKLIVLSLYISIRGFFGENKQKPHHNHKKSLCKRSAITGEPSDDPKNRESVSEDSEDSSEDIDSDIEVDPDVSSHLWQWPSYEKYTDKYGRKVVKKCDNVATKNLDHQPHFKVTYHIKKQPWAEQVRVHIYSPFLIKVLRDIMPDWFDSETETEISLWATQLFHIRDKLKQRHDAGKFVEESNEQLHLGHMLRFMDAEFEKISARYATQSMQGRVSWELLWAFFPPGETIVYHCNVTEEEVFGEVVSTYYTFNDNDELVFRITLGMWDYDCKTWGQYSLVRDVDEYKGELVFTSMQTYPKRFTSDPNGLEKGFLEKGERFWELSMRTSNCFMSYKGPIFVFRSVNGCVQLHKENADGRVMIDLGSFSKMNPDYNLRTAKPPCEVLRDNKVTLIDISSREDRKFAPAMVYGFSFRLKAWGSFSVCGFTDIKFNDSAFDALVMASPETKELTYTLVREYVKEGKDEDNQNLERVDPIVAKGEGCIFLCYGPPGTGKTLTAESIAEKLHCPLWSLSVSELGTTPNMLESMLVKIFGVAVSWGAIVLLDEADVYLEQRTSACDLTRNAMTGIFLRQLEYFRGVLFLTTNRIVTFDEAFCSRISMFLCYERHNEVQRRLIWKNLLERVGIKNFSSAVLAEFAHYDLNGREIRNVIQQAQTLAKSRRQDLNAQYLRQSLVALVSSLEVLTSIIRKAS